MAGEGREQGCGVKAAKGPERSRLQLGQRLRRCRPPASCWRFLFASGAGKRSQGALRAGRGLGARGGQGGGKQGRGAAPWGARRGPGRSARARGKGDEHGVTKAIKDWVRAQEQIRLGHAGGELTSLTNFWFLEARVSFILHSVGAGDVQVLSARPFLKACCRGWAVGIDSH